MNRVADLRGMTSRNTLTPEIFLILPGVFFGYKGLKIKKY